MLKKFLILKKINILLEFHKSTYLLTQNKEHRGVNIGVCSPDVFVACQRLAAHTPVTICTQGFLFLRITTAGAAANRELQIFSRIRRVSLLPFSRYAGEA